MFRKVDCIRIHVPNLEPAIEFYRDRLGLSLVWRQGREEAGLMMRDSDTELVLVTEKLEGVEVDLLVDSSDKAAAGIAQLGGTIEVKPFDIRIGRCAVVRDPWGNRFVLLDMSKGPLKADMEGNVTD